MSSSGTPERRSCAICAFPAPNRCSGCGQAFYCSQEHQTKAWPKHKRLCKIYQRQKRGEPVPSPDSYCGLCGKDNGPLRRTECCNRTICDDYGKYTPFSYSANSCSRNHDRYSRCCYHYKQKHPGDDPLKCVTCSEDHDPENVTWYLTNNFNFQEDILRARPPSFTPMHCTKCGKQVKQNADHISLGRSGAQCERCAENMAPVPPGSMPKTTYRLND
ncbi:hypothetical protein BD626DRAFT_406006 [Schizophyllum amplum]|uniref:MYND-type domain-containing protein n=1 Tax=Schizophyllum amplum TaxID=97359 RepID=A0A550C993_9AGAR|nr:hypothetical protein BD626DRAFT_406006 [Auriculariopsis ampla]